MTLNLQHSIQSIETVYLFFTFNQTHFLIFHFVFDAKMSLLNSKERFLEFNVTVSHLQGRIQVDA